MIEVTILYPAAPGRRFDHEYYETRHIPLTLDLLGPVARSLTVVRGIDPGAPWPAPTYASVCRIRCDSFEAYQAALFPHLGPLQADVPRFSDLRPVIQICEVALERP